MPAFSSTVRRGDLFLIRLADWLVVLIAIALPWSTTATEICIVLWLLAVLPTLDLAAIKRELEKSCRRSPSAVVVSWFNRNTVGQC